MEFEGKEIDTSLLDDIENAEKFIDIICTKLYYSLTTYDRRPPTPVENIADWKPEPIVIELDTKRVLICIEKP